MAKMKHYFSVARLLKALDAKEKLIAIYEKKYTNPDAAGLDILYTIAEAVATNNAESEFYACVADLTGIDREQAESMDEVELFEAVTNAVGLDELLKFFRKYINN